MSELKIEVIKSNVLGVNVCRGYAKLSDLSKISSADIYDKKNNPTGTQRDLSPKHARDAYAYISTSTLGFWPEIFLCARNPNVVRVQENNDKTWLIIDLDKIEKNKNINSIDISRVDGNHRLHYADGKTEGYPAINKTVSFCIALNLTLDNEIILFRDINNNQRRMNTSHLDNIEIRLSGVEALKYTAPNLYISKKLSEDTSSPFYSKVYDGGKKVSAAFVPLRSLQSGIKLLLSRATKLSAIPDAEAKYKVIKNYFMAVRKWIPEAWDHPKDYIALRGAGLWAICNLGAEVIDRSLSKGEFSSEYMLKTLRSGKTWDWSNNGEFKGYSGQGGASKIRDLIVHELSDETGTSIKKLYNEIMNQE